MTEPADLISISEAARKLGLNKSTLARQLKNSDIPLVGGKVSFASVLAFRAASIDLTRSRRREGKGDEMDGAEHSTEKPAADGAADATAPSLVDATPLVDATAAEDGDEPVLIDGQSLPYGLARALKETYLARLRKLEYETKRGALVEIEEIGRQVEAEYSMVRERLLAIPGKMAALLVDLDRAEIEEALRAEVCEALSELHSR